MLSFRNVLIFGLRRVVAAAIIQTFDSLHLKYPEVGPDKLKEIAAPQSRVGEVSLWEALTMSVQRGLVTLKTQIKARQAMVGI